MRKRGYLRMQAPLRKAACLSPVWLIMTRACLQAASVPVPRAFFAVRSQRISGSNCNRGVRAHMSSYACMNTSEWPRLYQARGPTRSRHLKSAYPRANSVALRLHAPVLAAFSELPARPQLAPAARGVSRHGTGTACLSPDGGPLRQHPAVGVRGSIPRVGSAARSS